MEPPPGIAPGWPAYRADTSLTMLWGLWKWSARDDLHVQGCLILSQVGLLFPVNHAPMKLASLTGFAPVISCMRGRHVGWTTPQGLGKAPNPKIQIPKKLQIPSSKAERVAKLEAQSTLGLESSGLEFLWSLALGVWSFEVVSPAGISPATWSLGHSCSVL